MSDDAHAGDVPHEGPPGTLTDVEIRKLATDGYHDERVLAREVLRLRALHAGMIERDGMLRSECCTCAPRCARCGRELGRNDNRGPVPQGG